mmetsp:Transcript_100714/g.323394  ORF Transcript_100714/g.323394 Transcript_100714/m.323394 type:complete len:185 (+) Transcript_100714:84-638(+)
MSASQQQQACVQRSRRTSLLAVVAALASVAALAATAAAGLGFAAGGGVLAGQRLSAHPQASWAAPATRPLVARGFFGGADSEMPKNRAAEATDVTPADKAQEIWKNPVLQGIIGFLMTASTVLDVAGLFTGEAGVASGLGEAIAGLDVTAGESALEAITQSGEAVVESAQEQSESLFEFLKGSK